MSEESCVTFLSIAAFVAAAALLCWVAIRIYRSRRMNRLRFSFNPMGRTEPEWMRRMKQ